MMNKTLAAAISAALLLSACGGDDGKDGNNGAQGPAGPQGPAGTAGEDLTVAPKLIRLATTPLKSEITGMYKTDNGEFFFNVQHPSTSLPGDENKAAVGAWIGVDVDNLDPRMESLALPSTDAEASTTRVALGSYQVLGREGDTFAGSLPFGLGAIVNAAGDGDVKQSPNPDFNAFIPSNADGSAGYLFTAWEDRPGAVSRIALTKADDGSWTTGSAMNVDFSSVNGTMINCFGTVSPWGTPLTSEENYEAENAHYWNNPQAPSNAYPNYADVQNIQAYLDGTFPNPYDYGYIVEITNPTDDNPVPVKHFTLGRFAHENPVIMPDQKTVYLTDDGTAKAFYKFVADEAGDLSAGTLYVAKVTQDATRDPSKAGFDIEWMEMAHATNAQIEAWIDEYDGIDEEDFVDGETSYISDEEVTAWKDGEAADDRVVFLETLRAARAMGATAEFDKMEGININYDGAASGAVPFMYVAMSDVRNNMADSEGDIQVDAARCGIVYRFGLHADYDVSRMEPAVVGGPIDSEATENQCALDNISNPDNIVVLDDGRVMIGEDTGRHENNMLWLYNPAGK